MSHTHMTAPTQFLEVKGIRFAYRRFGKETGVPLVFMQHFRGGLDHWDPAITDGLGRDRPVVLFDNAGVADRAAIPLTPSKAWASTPLLSSVRSTCTDRPPGILDRRLCGAEARSAPHAAWHRAARRCAYARNNGVHSGSRQREPQSRKGSMARVVALMKPPASDETANVAHLQIRNFGTTKARSWALFDLR
jgi:hypothetical protein